MLIAVRHPNPPTEPGDHVMIFPASSPDVAIYCRRPEGAEWEPMWVVDCGRKKELPSCFALSDEALDALNRIVEL